MEERIMTDRKEQRTEQEKRIEEGRYCTRYKELRTEHIPKYLQKKYKGRDQRMIARYRCGNEEEGSKYWRKEEERVCRICGEKKETLEHLRSDCVETLRDDRNIKDILKDTGEGADWMRKVIKLRKDRGSEQGPNEIDSNAM
ncbi:PREDICTED: uncharacterized protein LOC105569733 [Vollenhovia emeryi]|uniref:uncharacterized protein LOC105569733 n=1 Tax=Vollenhovia emeryi TaxID=411798 RepID=UPI0005F4F0DC|nr:PREDICTED: uncharacterized protein LOC105569733 [Vollenhovia emeryi]XP_011881813.1 PREDICTED: uncharacterized protein LOC105569733 [Vollenhovia emeryi]